MYENSGFPSCLGALIAAAKKVIMVSRYKQDGTPNKITLPATLNQAYFDALINNTDRFQRWYPLPNLKNVTTDKAESVYQSFDDGSKAFVHEGVRTLTGIVPGFNPNFLSVLKSGRCTDMAIYVIDKKGTLVGYTNGEENVLYPMPLNPNTIDAIWTWATDSTQSNINLSMEFNTDMKDEYIGKIDAGDLATGVNLLNLNGLVDGFVAYTSTGATSMVFKLKTNFGSVANPIVIQGLVAADFALYNVTDSAAVTVSTCTENPKGTYTLTYTSQTTSDVIRLTPTKTGFDFTPVIEKTSVVV